MYISRPPCFGRFPILISWLLAAGWLVFGSHYINRSGFVCFADFHKLAGWEDDPGFFISQSTMVLSSMKTMSRILMIVLSIRFHSYNRIGLHHTPRKYMASSCCPILILGPLPHAHVPNNRNPQMPVRHLCLAILSEGHHHLVALRETCL